MSLTVIISVNKKRTVAWMKILYFLLTVILGVLYLIEILLDFIISVFINKS